ncbi:hypothetical protein ASG23_06875 [Cellulomonas sp. Leaf395]|nr:hypothetical protein ASG23_06875 [Cellulomonas sp. Leaf395]
MIPARTATSLRFSFFITSPTLLSLVTLKRRSFSFLRFSAASVREDANLVILAHWASQEFHSLRCVPLEVQSERATVRKRVSFALKVLRQLRVLVGDLADEVDHS